MKATDSDADEMLKKVVLCQPLTLYDTCCPRGTDFKGPIFSLVE